MSAWSGEIAWALAEFIRRPLDRRTRTQLFVTLGAGEYEQFIWSALKEVVNADVALPTGLDERIQCWRASHDQA